MKFNKIYIELTNICGLECSFCPSKKDLVPQVISLKNFENILQEIKPYTNTITYHIFGDPLALSNLNEYLDLTYQYNFKVEIVTTGYYLKKFQLDIFLHPCIKQINFSLNSYDKNNLSISLDEYMQPMLELCDLKLKKNKNMFINFRLWNLNDTNCDEKFNNTIIHKLFNYFNITNLSYEIDKPIRLNQKILIDFDKYFEWPTLKSRHTSHGFCYGLKSHIGILSNGNVVPCCLDSFGVINLGNIFSTSLTNILMSEKASNMRIGFQNNLAIEELCQKCTFKKRFNE